MFADVRPHGWIIVVAVLLLIYSALSALLTATGTWYDLVLLGLIFFLALLAIALETSAFAARARTRLAAWQARWAPAFLLASMVATVARGSEVLLGA